MPAALGAATRRVVRVTGRGRTHALSVCGRLEEVAAGVPGEATPGRDDARHRRRAPAREGSRRVGAGPPFLPGYPPDPSPTGRPWRFVEEEALGARRRDGYEAAAQAIGGCLDQLPTRHEAKMDALLTPDFQLLDDVPMPPA